MYVKVYISRMEWARKSIFCIKICWKLRLFEQMAKKKHFFGQIFWTAFKTQFWLKYHKSYKKIILRQNNVKEGFSHFYDEGFFFWKCWPKKCQKTFFAKKHFFGSFWARWVKILKTKVLIKMIRKPILRHLS